MAWPDIHPSNFPEHQNEGQLVADYLERSDERLFAIIVARYKDQVFRLALSILGPYRVPDAEDVAQDVFMRIHRALPTFRQESSLGTWIYRIAFNIAVDYTRRASFRLQHLPADALRSRPAAGEAADSERSAAIHAAMARLPGLIRSVLYLHYWLGCSVEEVGKCLGIPPGTVKSYLRRGRAQMHRIITGQRRING